MGGCDYSMMDEREVRQQQGNTAYVVSARFLRSDVQGFVVQRISRAAEMSVSKNTNICAKGWSGRNEEYEWTAYVCELLTTSASPRRLISLVSPRWTSHMESRLIYRLWGLNRL